MRALLDAGLIHGDCLTVTGKTVAGNLADIRPGSRWRHLAGDADAARYPPADSRFSTGRWHLKRCHQNAGISVDSLSERPGVRAQQSAMAAPRDGTIRLAMRL